MLLAMTAAVLVRPEEWWSTSSLRAIVPRLALAAAVSSVVLFPFLLPYYQMHERLGLTRPLDEIARMSATWHDYLATAGRIHWALWSHRFVNRTSLFPGVIGLALTGFAVASGTAFTDRRARMCLAAGVAGVMFSLGTALSRVRGPRRARPAAPGHPRRRAVRPSCARGGCGARRIRDCGTRGGDWPGGGQSWHGRCRSARSRSSISKP